MSEEVRWGRTLVRPGQQGPKTLELLHEGAHPSFSKQITQQRVTL